MASTQVIPQGGTWFDTLNRGFYSVRIADDNAISTTEFLEAAESLTTLFDLLGSVAFTPVKNDLLGNIKKIRDRQLAAPAESETLQALVLNELKAKKNTATVGLLWLVRGLDFTAQALRHNISNPTDELSASFRVAYGKTLKPYHNFLIKPIFTAAMGATPYRKDFYANLGDDSVKSQAALELSTTSLEKIVSILKEFLETPEVKKAAS
ncbi:glycolipid transferprotein HET-C2 [Paracoccidioides lutzii Pb01]|uniref:Glycolipid transferprotein HET-C2 n=1 Tax=Paracoccidioides lutzii (strain ATCC MYA-826 / Pb01) TaxID=502779 RepID=C1H4Y6_PARBA|nr:glycolipid transferprotein HET-C2 [Paracoccidioides lutzii Pb01]EEH34780.1 glycolipid transferprotein HET-C2 [Paracoccidioides lutzii Pb01]